MMHTQGNIKKHSPPVPYVLETLVEVWGTNNCVETLALWACVPTSLSHSPKLPLVFQ